MGEDIQLFTHGHPYVEIGGVKWATMNVGAKSVTDAGLYFAWGEIRGYKPEEFGDMKVFTSSDYKFYDGLYYNKYNGKDKLDTLQLQDDPVHVAWRGGWRLPTTTELSRLLIAARREWVFDYNGSHVNGLLFRDESNPTNELFLPSTGFAYKDRLFDSHLQGHYWAANLGHDTDHAASKLFISHDGAVVGYGSGRTYGFSVRGVLG